MAYALGIDLGGTKILAAIIDTETGHIVSSVIRGTHAEAGMHGVVERMLGVAQSAIAEAHLDERDIRAAGIGVAGQVDVEHGVLIRAPNLPDELVGAPLGDTVRRALSCPVTLVNDVVAAAAGEASFGAGRGHPDFVCIFVGTGIGGAIYRDGRPYVGATNTAGELGHTVVDAGGRICGCGGQGHLEAYASRTAVVRTILGALRQGRASSLAHLEPDPNPEDVADSAVRDTDVAEAVRQGDALAIELVEEGARYMAAGLASVINFYNPPRIILGGGMVEKVPLYFERSAALGRDTALSVPRRQVDIVRAELGDNSGVVGAAMLATHRA